MTPVALTQSPSDSPYARQVQHVWAGVDGLSVDAHRQHARFTAERPVGQRDVRIQDLQHATDEQVGWLVDGYKAEGVQIDRLLLDEEGEGVRDPDSAIRRNIRPKIARLREAWPNARISNFDCISTLPVDGKSIRELNDNPGDGDAFEFDEEALPLYGHAGSLLSHREVIATPHGMLVWSLNQIHGVHRAYERTGRGTPAIMAYLAPRLCGRLDLPRWRALAIHTTLRCGPVFYYFNGDCSGFRPDAELTSVCAEVADEVPGEYRGTLGLTVADRLPNANATTVASFAVTSTGTYVFATTRDITDDTITVTIPSTTKTVTVTRRKGDYSGWARVKA